MVVEGMSEDMVLAALYGYAVGVQTHAFGFTVPELAEMFSVWGKDQVKDMSPQTAWEKFIAMPDVARYINEVMTHAHLFGVA